MKDSILKGTGNSRFLKSAIPDGTTWAEALAMLRAGTFPMDLNGINNTGFQQVGTPLNKANLLKDVNALTLGLTGDAVPDDMFNVLAHAGDLHVWKKTVVTKEPVPEVPGSYTLGSAAITNLAQMTSNGYNGYAANILVSKEIKVNLDGSVELVSPTSRQMVVAGSTEQYTIDVNSDDLLGAGNRYFTPSEDSDYNSSRCNLLIPPGTVYYVAPGTTYTTARRSISSTSAFNAAQLVTGVPGTPAIPAGTTVTYPVSTNRNAYQEGSDAKPAGYTLGEVKTGSFAITSKSSPGGVGTRWNDSATLSVSDDGTCTLATTGGTYIDGTTTNAATTAKNELQGKFAYCNNTDTDFASSVIVFFPSNTIFTRVGNIVYADRYQPVTGYAAIPAGTTIEYLGCLGDKARVQVVSYVGTGTYGDGNECTVTFDFQPAVVISLGYINPKYPTRAYSRIDTGLGVVVFPAVLSATAYSSYSGFSLSNTTNYPSDAKVSPDRKSVIWKNTSSNYQLNSSGYTYYFLGIG